MELIISLRPVIHFEMKHRDAIDVQPATCQESKLLFDTTVSLKKGKTMAQIWMPISLWLYRE